MKAGLVLFAHGSRDPEWAAPFRTVRERVIARDPSRTVELAFLEVMKPSLPDAVDALVASGCQRITIAPLFMAQGAHLKRDLASLMAATRERHNGLELSLAPPLGEVDAVVDSIAQWLAADMS